MTKTAQPAEFLPISEVRNHPNADRLDIAKVNGFQVIIGRDTYSAGNMVWYYEPDTAFYEDQAIALGIDKYLSRKTDRYGDRVLVLRETKLRGVLSEGLIVKDIAGVDSFKYEAPPAKYAGGQADAAPEKRDFPGYGSLTNLKKEPRAIPDGAIVTVTEKIHGTNSRVGFVTDAEGNFVLLAGSRTVNRKYNPDSLYWLPTQKHSGIIRMLERLHSEGYHCATLYGEIYGPTVQNYSYGLQNTELGYVAFTLKINNVVQEPTRFETMCQEYEIPIAPRVVAMPYSFEAIEQMAEGPSLIAPMGFDKHAREGVVVQYGQDIYKYVCASYLLSKNNREKASDI
jgi:RNA ligase (TIGR02306 family)